MASVIEICNIALTRFGGDVIIDINEPSQAARMCKLHYPNIRDVVLKEYPWNFAQKIARLAAETETIPGYTYAYALPNGCLAAHRMFNESNFYDQKGTEFARYGRSLYTSIDQAYLEYTAKIEDPSEFDPNFIDTLAWKLAMEISVPLTGDKNMREHLYSLFQNSQNASQGVDAAEGYIKQQQSNRYAEVRL